MGFLNPIGGALNSVTGVNSSAKNQYQYAQGLQSSSFAQQKEFAQNAHQWEMEDLKKAGLNPALTMGVGGGASAGGAGGNAGGPGGSGSGIDLINSAISAFTAKKQSDQIDATTENLGADTAGKLLNNEIVKKYGSKEKDAQIANTMQDTVLKMEQAINHRTTSAKNLAETKGQIIKNHLDQKWGDKERTEALLGQTYKNNTEAKNKHLIYEQYRKTHEEYLEAKNRRKYGKVGNQLGQKAMKWYWGNDY